MNQPAKEPSPSIDWEAFYRNYRKPGYVQGFEIINKLGGGMFGLVYKARKESIGKDYAIKFLKVDDESVRDAVLREIDSVQHFAQIDHPNLVSIEDKGEADGIPYLVMSYAGQETLQKRISAGPMQREDALKIFIQVARGVQALHERSLVHFDLKPANIFLKGEVARVGDFGLSKLVTESRNSLSFGRGTPYYMAPEMLQRRGDSRSDIYSLGIMLYECLCGDVPFKGDSEWEVLKKHEVESPAFPASMLDADRRVLQRCLHKKPEARYASAAELLRDLHAPVALGESFMLPKPAPDALAAGNVPRPTAVRSSAQMAPALPRDSSLSPYGLPWRKEAAPRGLMAFLVRQLFRVFDLVIFCILLPVRLVSSLVSSGPFSHLLLSIRAFGRLSRSFRVMLAILLIILVIFFWRHLPATLGPVR